jgi:hypothetical protein
MYNFCSKYPSTKNFVVESYIAQQQLTASCHGTQYIFYSKLQSTKAFTFFPTSNMSTTVHIDRETISQFSHFVIVKRNKIFEIAYYVNPLERYSSVLVATQRFKSL